MFDRRAVLAHAVSMLASARGAAWAESSTRLPVVATFSILADFVRQVGGDRVNVTALVGPNGDAHVYQPSPSDAKTVGAARLVVVNGLGLEGWIDRLVKASGFRGPVVVAAAGVNPLHADMHAGGEGHAQSQDPHAWQDVANAKRYVDAIRDGLAAADPAGMSAYDANAQRYRAQLDDLDRDIRAELARIPPERRRVVTTHDAFGYFARAYGVAFIAPQGVSTEAEASAADVARIIRQVRAEKAPAVFLETLSDPRLMQRIAQETGARIGGRLYSDALSEQDGPAGTYIAMMRNNIRELSAALAP